MATASSVVNYTDALNVVTLPNIRRDKITDQVVDTSPFFALARGADHLVEEEGGLFLQETINVALSPNAGFYTGAGGWKMSTFQGLIALGWDWKLAHDGVVITGEELLKNDGFSDAIVSLIQARVDVTSLTLPDLFGTYLFRNNPYGTNIDGTTGDPSGFEGLCVQIDDGTVNSTIGQQSRTSYPILKSKVNYNATLTSTMIAQLQAMWSAANRGGMNRTKANFTTEAVYNAFWGYLQTPERYLLSPERLAAIGLKTTGGSDLAFNDSVVLIDEKCPTGIQKPVNAGGSGGMWYGLNTDFLEMVVHPSRFFSYGEWYKDPFGDQYFLDIYYAGAMKITRPNRQYALWFSGG
jgi:hypothetical protein